MGMATTTYSTNDLTKGQFSAAKRRLTLAKKRAVKQNDPRIVIDVVNEIFQSWDDGDFAYPDDWHRFNIARSDAEMALAYGTPMR